MLLHSPAQGSRDSGAHSTGSGREVDPHHDAPRAGAADLGESGVSEDLAAADVQLAPGDLLAWMGDHRVGLQCPGAACPGVVDRGRSQRVGDAALAVSLAGYEAGDGPDAVVCPVLVAAAPHCPHVRQPRIGGARFDGDPADRIRAKVGNKPGRGFGSRIIAIRLLAEPRLPLVAADGLPVAVPDLVGLAVAPAGVIGRAEYRPQVRPGRFVGGDDGQLRRRDRPVRSLCCRHSGSFPARPPTGSLIRSAWPTWRAYSSIMSMMSRRRLGVLPWGQVTLPCWPGSRTAW